MRQPQEAPEILAMRRASLRSSQASRGLGLGCLGLVACGGPPGGGEGTRAPGSSASHAAQATPNAPGASSGPLWRETFDQAPSWQSPSHQNSPWIPRIYGRSDQGWLSARHDAREGQGAPAVHYGYPFPEPPSLAAVPILKWRWRVGQHPKAKEPWQDLAASIYVIHERPGLFGGGRGFKLGWTSAPAPGGTKQRGLRQIALRHDPASSTWHTERVDLCALYQEHYGDCADARILYIGVVTDADGSESVARADYDDFELGPGASR